MGTLAIAGAALLASGALLFKPIQSTLYTTAGFGRTVQDIEEFPFKCHKLIHPDLEACEDIFLDDAGRKAYLACSSTLARTQWMPAVDKLNNSGRALTDHFSVLSLDHPGTDGLFGLKKLKTRGYDGVRGEQVLDLHGFDVEDIGANALRFFVVNHRPPVDADGKDQDASKVGANSTVEVFTLDRRSDTLVHQQTIHDELVKTPNRVAADGEGGFMVVNDKSDKLGFRRQLDLYMGGGSVVHCGKGRCQRASTTKLAFPNGLSKSHKDGRYYVPSSSDGNIYVFEATVDKKLTLVDTIETFMPMDNLHIDAAGDIYAASFPKLFDILKAFEDPINVRAASTVNRIRKTASGWEVSKILEDSKGKVLPASTSAVHDLKTGRIILGSVLSQYVTICDPK